jgi:hypothetical protein
LAALGFELGVVLAWQMLYQPKLTVFKGTTRWIFIHNVTQPLSVPSKHFHHLVPLSSHSPILLSTQALATTNVLLILFWPHNLIRNLLPLHILCSKPLQIFGYISTCLSQTSLIPLSDMEGFWFFFNVPVVSNHISQPWHRVDAE